MLRTRVIPCLLVNNGRLVKTVKFKNPSYIGDPVNAIKIYNEKEVDELILLDITATVEKRSPPFQLLSEVVDELFMPLTYGGGISSIEHIKKLLAMGIEKVSINSHAVENPSFIRQASELFGSQSIVVSMDVKKTLLGKYHLYTHGGKKNTGIDPVAFAQQMEKAGAGEILLYAMDRDGTMEGYDINLIRKVTDEISIPVISCGGAGNTSDFAKAVEDGGSSAVAAGSMVVYQNKNLGVLINFPTREELQSVLD